MKNKHNIGPQQYVTLPFNSSVILSLNSDVSPNNKTLNAPSANEFHGHYAKQILAHTEMMQKCHGYTSNGYGPL